MNLCEAELHNVVGDKDKFESFNTGRPLELN